jgi:hypothetical protein
MHGFNATTIRICTGGDPGLFNWTIDCAGDASPFMVERLEPVWFAKAMKKAVEFCPIFSGGYGTPLPQAGDENAVSAPCPRINQYAACKTFSTSMNG